MEAIKELIQHLEKTKLKPKTKKLLFKAKGRLFELMVQRRIFLDELKRESYKSSG